MAATIAIARGVDVSRRKEVHRLGSRYAEAEANTWRTFARVTTFANGAGECVVTRDGRPLHRIRWEAEDVTDAKHPAPKCLVDTWKPFRKPIGHGVSCAVADCERAAEVVHQWRTDQMAASAFVYYCGPHAAEWRERDA